MTPEHFTDDIESIYDPAETGFKGCLEPLIDDPPTGGDDDGEH